MTSFLPVPAIVLLSLGAIVRDFPVRLLISERQDTLTIAVRIT